MKTFLTHSPEPITPKTITLAHELVHHDVHTWASPIFLFSCQAARTEVKERETEER